MMHLKALKQSQMKYFNNHSSTELIEKNKGSILFMESFQQIYLIPVLNG